MNLCSSFQRSLIERVDPSPPEIWAAASLGVQMSKKEEVRLAAASFSAAPCAHNTATTHCTLTLVSHFLNGFCQGFFVVVCFLSWQQGKELKHPYTK